MAQIKPDLKTLTTPEKCVADFCLIPVTPPESLAACALLTRATGQYLQIGTPTASVSRQIADVQRLMQQSGLKYSMHSAGTTVEGSWDDVMRLIGQAHVMLHERGVLRIQTDIRIGSRIDKQQSFDDKVTKVEELLAQDSKS